MVATDAPLLSHQINRLCKRVALGNRAMMEADAYLERLSVAQGRALGDRMKQKTLDHATLSYGAYAGAMLDQGPRRTTITFRLPRGF